MSRAKRSPSNDTRTSPAFSARSVIASTLLGTYPPRLSPRRLVRSCSLFGIGEGAARVALSRMLAAGEVTLQEGRYALAGRLLERQTRQADGRSGLARSAWDGTWVVHIVTAENRDPSARTDLRDAMRRLHVAELREGTWLRPDNLDGERDGVAATLVERQCATLHGARPARPDTLTADLFHLGDWADTAKALINDLEGAEADLATGNDPVLASSFARNAEVLRHLLADPLLPIELLPPHWPGAELRSTFERFDHAFSEAWQRAMRDEP